MRSSGPSKPEMNILRASPVAEPYADVASDESIHPPEKVDFYDLTQDSTLNWESTPVE